MRMRARITLEEYLEAPEEKPYREYWKGEVVEKVPPSFAHSFLQSRLAQRLGNWAEQEGGGDVLTEQRCILSVGERREALLPDVCWFPEGAFPTVPQGSLTLPPRLAVEILSPGDSFARLQERVQFLLEVGVASVWVVDPPARSVVVWPPGRVVEDVLTDPVLPGFRLELPDLFGRLG